MKKFKHIVFGLILFTLLNNNIFARNKKTIIIGSSNGGSSRNFKGLTAVAKELGYFEEEFSKLGYKVEYQTFDNGIAVNEAFLSNDVDFSYIGDVPGITGLTNNIGSVWIGSNISIQSLGIAVGNNTGITKPTDFLDKTIAVNIGTTAHLIFGKYFEDAGIDLDKLTTVNLNLANGVVAVITGDADAVFGDVTNLYPADKKGELKIIFTSAEKPEWASQSLLLGNKKTLKKNPELGVAFLKAIIRGRQKISESPEDYYQIISANGFDNNLDIANKIYNPDGKLGALNPEINADAIRRAQGLDDFFYSIGRLKERKDVRTFLDDSYYKKAATELGVTGF